MVSSLLVATAGCDAASSSHRDQAGQATLVASYDSLFRFVSSMELEEPDTAVIASVRFAAIDAGGHLALSDQIENQARVYDSTGRLLRSLGRRGEGPGEFDKPFDVAFDVNGGLLVTEGMPRITRYHPSLTLDTLFQPRYPLLHHQIRGLDNGFLIARMPGPGQRDSAVIAVYDEHGTSVGRLHVPDSRLYETPYWLNATTFLVAASSHYIFVAGSLLYPIHRYSTDGVEHMTLGSPPPSWVPVPPTERGQFVGPNALREFRQWYRTFTTIYSLEVYRDSLLFVTHRELDPEVEEYQEASYTLDVYALSGEKLAEDLRLPGRPIAARDYLYLVIREPPHPWTVARYAVRSDRLRG